MPKPPVLAWHDLCFRSSISYPDQTLYTATPTLLTGPSGTGKTSLLRLLNRTATPTHGSITYQGKNISQLDPLILRREVLLVDQEPYLFPGTVTENFQKYHALAGTSSPSVERQRDLLLGCSISPHSEQPCTNFSGGERQRIFLAIALSFQPHVLLLDEPTAALDLDTSVALLENIAAAIKADGRALLVVAHDQSLQSRLGWQIWHLDPKNGE